MANRLNIFVIDEGLELCQDLRGWLEQDGHRVNCSPVSRVLFASLANLSPDLIVIGLAKYDGPGMVMFRKLASHRSLRQVPVIVVSEDADLEHEVLDALDFQLRPLDRARFRLILQRLLASRRSGPRPVTLEPAQLAAFKNYLLEHSGLNFNQHNQRLLERALLRRVQTLLIDSLPDYFQYLTRSAENYDELNKLVGLLTVGETSFFRYRSHREALLHAVLPQLIEKNRHARTLRVWSAGCSTGEEPYSLAILLRDNFPELADWHIQIEATDINKRALRHAREGIYGERALRMMETPLRQRYFSRTGEYFQVSRQIRNMVRFGYLNLQTGPFPQNLDLLLCRNVMIYFDLDTIRRIVTHFSQALVPGGFLFMGHAETMQNVSDRFQRHHQHNAFYYQVKVADLARPRDDAPPRQAGVVKEPAPAAAPAPSARVKAAPAPQPKAPLPDPQRLYHDAMTAFEHEKFADAGKLFDQLLTLQPGHPQALVGKGLLLANQGQYSEARICCAKAIKENDLMPEAYLLRGLVLDMEGLLERALVEYQKVLWLEPGFVMAHYLTAQIHDRRGDREKRQRALRNTARALEQSRDPDVVPFSGGLSRSVFLEIVHGELSAEEPQPPLR